MAGPDSRIHHCKDAFKVSLVLCFSGATFSYLCAGEVGVEHCVWLVSEFSRCL